MATEKYHSLVYRDTDMQSYLKDILIPLIGYRDVGHTWGSFRDSIDKLKVEVKAMQIPPKSKFYKHDDFNIPVYIKIIENSYEYPDTPSFEPTFVTIEFARTFKDLTEQTVNERRYSFTVCIPGGSQLEAQKQPYCVSCNSNTYQDIKSINIAKCNDPRNENPDVFRIMLPLKTVDENDVVNGGSVTVYSENRNVEAVTTWNSADVNDPNIAVNWQWDPQMGTIPYFDPVEDVDRLVYSSEIREIVALTLPALEYLQETGNTDPETLYVGREDDESSYQGRISFNTVEDFKRELPTIFKIFGYNWRNLDIEFADEVTNIDGLLEGNTDIQGTPRAILGNGIVSAKRLFKDSSVNYIDSQDHLFSSMPNLKYLDEAFAGSQLKTPIEAILVEQCKNLISVRRMFANSMIQGTEPLWLIPDLEFEGMNCFNGCTRLPSSDTEEMPTYWRNAGTNPTIEYYTRAGFDRVIDYVLECFNNDLSKVTIDCVNSIELAGLFEGKPITHTPAKIIDRGTQDLSRMFANCPELEVVSAALLNDLPHAENLSEMFLNDIHILTLPSNFSMQSKDMVNLTRMFSGLTQVTGQAPMINGINLWNLAGQEGYQTSIDGTDCFANSPFANASSIPAAWGGTGA